MTKEEQYKKNQRKSKILKVITPIVFWAMIGLAIILFVVAFSSGIENINEIYDLLDSKVYNDTQLGENYNYLVGKYGELVVGTGSSGFTIHFVNFKGAIFNGMIVALTIVSMVMFIGAFLVGKWLLPYYTNKLEQENQDMVNLTILRNEDSK